MTKYLLKWRSRIQINKEKQVTQPGQKGSQQKNVNVDAMEVKAGENRKKNGRPNKYAVFIFTVENKTNGSKIMDSEEFKIIHIGKENDWEFRGFKTDKSTHDSTHCFSRHGYTDRWINKLTKTFQNSLNSRIAQTHWEALILPQLFIKGARKRKNRELCNN